MTFSPRAIEAAAAHVIRELDDRGLLKDVTDDLFSEIGNDVAEAALSAALAVDGVALQGWQPIESAPKERTRVLLFHDNGNGPGYRTIGEFREYIKDKPDWRTDSGVKLSPTHWQPLPRPPAASDREERR